MTQKKTPNPIDVEVGARIKILRSAKKITQETLSAAIGVTFQQVQKYEKGQNRIGASRLALISQVLDVPVSYFFEDSVDGLIDAQDENFAELLQFAHLFVQIKNPDKRRGIMALIHFLAAAADEESSVAA